MRLTSENSSGSGAGLRGARQRDNPFCMDYLPVFLQLQARPVVVVGGGRVAARKIELLRRTGARITVVAPELLDPLRELAATVVDFWAENGLEHERCGEMIERIGLANFLEGIGVEVDPNMITHPRTSSYVRLDDWDQEAQKWIDRKTQQVA